MAKSLKKIIQHTAYQLVLKQLACVLGLSSFALLVGGPKSGLSVLAGGSIYGLPNLFFVWRVFRYAGANEMARFIAAFIFGEMVKLVLCAILFIVIVKYLPVSLLSVLVGLAGAIVSFWVVCLWQFSRQTDTKQQNLKS